MLTYFLGPIIALFPKPWRDSFAFAKAVKWGRATTISGMIELMIGLFALSEWYAHVMSTWVRYGVSQALDGKMGPEVRIQDVGGAALIIWATHPVTWMLGYVVAEGAVRASAGAFSGTACSSLPLYLVDFIFVRPFRPRSGSPANSGPGVRANVSSYFGAVHERIHSGNVREVPDELCFSKADSDETLEVNSCRRKQDWTPPRVVRYFDAYYRLEETTKGGSDRPFRYRLRRLAAGVPSRSVLLYAPTDAVIRELNPSPR